MRGDAQQTNGGTPAHPAGFYLSQRAVRRFLIAFQVPMQTAFYLFPAVAIVTGIGTYCWAFRLGATEGSIG